MKRSWFASALALLGICLPLAFAGAHPLDVAYLDFAVVSSTQVTLTVAVHPYQAYELVKGSSKLIFDLKALQANGDLVSAYIQNHVSVSRGGGVCRWDAGPAQTPDTELDAVADGVIVVGDLQCPGNGNVLSAQSDLFLDGFPTQTSVLRIELPDGYAERTTLDRTTRSGTIDLTEIYTAQAVTSTPLTPAQRRPDAALADLAMRALDPRAGLMGLIGVLLAVAVIGALHALGPGHGKSLMAATLVGNKASVSRVVALGTVMTLTHVADVFLLAIFASFISLILPPISLLYWLEVVSAAALTVFGLIGLIRAVLKYRLVRNNPEYGNLDDAHARAHELGLPHSHEHAHEHASSDHEHHDAANFKQALWLGFLGSLAPCPSAWAVFMATLAAGRPGMGLALLVAFTVGLHLTILSVGFLLIASRSFALKKTPAKLTYALPIVSAALIMGLGAVLLVSAL